MGRMISPDYFPRLCDVYIINVSMVWGALKSHRGGRDEDKILRITGKLLIPRGGGLWGAGEDDDHSPQSLSRQGRGRTGGEAHRGHGVDAVDVIVRPAGRQLVGILLLLEQDEGLDGPPPPTPLPARQAHSLRS